MRATAKIDELPRGVEGDHRLVGLFLDKLAFEDLVGILIELQCLGLGQELAFVLQVSRRKFAHFLFDFFEVFRGERLLSQEFVEETVFHRRANAEFHVGIKLRHGRCQQVRGRMAEDVERVGIFFGQDAKLDVLLQRAAKVVEQATIGIRINGIRKNAGLGVGAITISGVDLGNQRGVGQPRRDGSGDFNGRDPFWKVLHAAVG